MGTLTYAGFDYRIEDRLLAHLKIAIAAKLRVGEAFLLNWQIPVDEGSGRVSLWISPDIPLSFRFSGSKPPEMNRRWLDALARSAHGIRGMVVMNEDQAAEYVAKAGSPAAP
ncbi:hypothetical protein D7I44_08550 [Gryllotalpicola protaetiae]|uniref:DUF7882 domain-containing protein n=2 Tax=Gryllotalpicola protaetiae TaxID=2419771 RepID=A0A387BRH2_9MICO|nr:hypothetical protein D7I44_08550 [Gryllotalpicola protaetiae]